MLLQLAQSDIFLLHSVLVAVSFGSVMAAKKKASWKDKDSKQDVFRACFGAYGRGGRACT